MHYAIQYNILHYILHTTYYKFTTYYILYTIYYTYHCSGTDLKYAEYIERKQSETKTKSNTNSTTDFDQFVHSSNRHEIMMDPFKYSVNTPGDGIGDPGVDKKDPGIVPETHEMSPETRDVGDGIGGLSTEDAEDILYHSGHGRNEFEVTNPLADWIVVAQDWLRQYLFISVITIILCVVNSEWFSFLLIIVTLVAVTSLRFYNEIPLKYEHIISTVNR